MMTCLEHLYGWQQAKVDEQAAFLRVLGGSTSVLSTPDDDGIP